MLIVLYYWLLMFHGKLRYCWKPRNMKILMMKEKNIKIRMKINKKESLFYGIMEDIILYLRISHNLLLKYFLNLWYKQTKTLETILNWVKNHLKLYLNIWLKLEKEEYQIKQWMRKSRINSSMMMHSYSHFYNSIKYTHN